LEYLGVALVSLELQHLDLTASIKHLQELVDIMLTDWASSHQSDYTIISFHDLSSWFHKSEVTAQVGICNHG